MRARIEAAYLRLLSDPEGAAGELLELVEAAIPTFEALADDRALSRAWLLSGYVQGGLRGHHLAWERDEERALHHYRRTGFPIGNVHRTDRCSGLLGADTRTEGDREMRRLLDETIGHSGRAAVIPFIGGLEAQVGRFSRARELVAEAEQIYEELGSPTSAMSVCGTVLADIELLAADYSRRRAHAA